MATLSVLFGNFSTAAPDSNCHSYKSVNGHCS